MDSLTNLERVQDAFAAQWSVKLSSEIVARHLNCGHSHLGREKRRQSLINTFKLHFPYKAHQQIVSLPTPRPPTWIFCWVSIFLMTHTHTSWEKEVSEHIFCSLPFSTIFSTLGVQTGSRMISDVQLAIFANVLGVTVFLLVVLFHYVSANNPKNKE